MIQFKPGTSQNSDSGNSYIKHFQIAHKNLMMVLQEQKITNPRQRKRFTKKDRA